MKRISFRQTILFTATALFLLVAAQASAEDTADGAVQGPGGTGLQQRIDFSSAQILGQSIKDGAVYLMHRKQSEISSMLKVRQDYRKEIMEDFSIEGSALIVEAAADENLDSETSRLMDSKPDSDANQVTDKSLSARRKNGNQAKSKPNK